MDCAETHDVLCINIIKETQTYMEVCLLLTAVLIYGVPSMKQPDIISTSSFAKIERSPMVEFSLHLEGVWNMLNFLDCKFKNLVVQINRVS